MNAEAAGPRLPTALAAGATQRLEADSALLRLNPAEAQWRCTRGYVEDVACAIALAAVDGRSAPPSRPVNWSVPLAADTRRIRAHLGYEEPVGRVEGLRRTVRAAAADAPGIRAT